MASRRRRPAPAQAAAVAGGSRRNGGRRQPHSSQRAEQRAPRVRRRPELLSRILVAIPAAVLAIGLVDIGGLAWALFMIAMGCVCLHELYRMLARWRPVALVGYAALIAMGLAARYGTPRYVLEVAVISVPALFVAVLARRQPAGGTVSIAGTLLGVVWIGLGFAHAVLLRQLPDGKGVMIDVMLGTFLGDTAAYLGGRLFGRRPLAPSISPKKTLEGLVCGMLIAIVSVFCATLFQPWLTHGDALALGVAIAVLGPIGDLFESLVKREAGAKDAGSLFGAHGGALDRLDGVIFTVVAGYYIWLALPHG
jgi:phosphatidate cytidylyltransferase